MSKKISKNLVNHRLGKHTPTAEREVCGRNWEYLQVIERTRWADEKGPDERREATNLLRRNVDRINGLENDQSINYLIVAVFVSSFVNYRFGSKGNEWRCLCLAIVYSNIFDCEDQLRIQMKK